MFNSGVIFVLALISLSAGAVLIDPVKRPKEVSRGLCNVIGFFVIVLSIIALLFSGYCMLKTYSYKRHMIYRGIILNRPESRFMRQNYMQGQMPMQQHMMPGMQGQQQMPMQQHMMPGKKKYKK